MTPDYLELRRSRDFGDMLNLTFAFSRQNAGILLKSLFTICFPPMLPAVLFLVLMIYQRGTGESADSSFLPVLTVVMMLSFLAVIILAIGVVHTVVLLYVRKEGGEITVGEVWQCIRENIGMLISTSVASFFIILLGYALFLIPGLWLSIVLSPIYMVRFQEQLTFGKAFERCRYLIEGHWWFTFGLYFLLSMIMGFLGYVFLLPGFALSFTPFSRNLTVTAIVLVIGYIGGALLRIIVVIAGALQYYNLVERKEGTGSMATLIDRIGVAEE